MFGPHLRTLREARGWSQRELARRAGIKSQTVNTIENQTAANRFPSAPVLCKLARAFEVSLDDLAAPICAATLDDEAA
jgi:transcriptional regulator with XRE-family HTH domain